ncbi:uncharacterized protein N7482_010126 [Penicillium canariense]|uniref:Dienelactone hydrolase n=1 Tax=Penicillium canariense TaxID=189055 RepID=A0A9W9HKW8_9EURO|nr:uncharacterized protein N7482_010126 [Penicillium canariense]KAJ5150874.1 hypothetical protein N7482_010126 [Penicillium canariense]
MVNIFQRLSRRAATSSSSAVPDPGINGKNVSSRSHDLHRTVSGSSGKHHRRSVAEEPSPRHLILISDNANFDPHIIQRFQADGFNVTYLGFVCTEDAEKDRKSLEFAVHEKEDELETGERYAIVAYNRPAYYLLGSHHLAASKTNPFPRLCALIAYYPLTSTNELTEITSHDQECCAPACSDTSGIFDPSPSATFLPIQIHLPGSAPSSRTFWPWISVSPSEGDVTYKKRHRCHIYTYPEARAGFAEHKPVNYSIKDGGPHHDDRISSQLAWSRTLGCLRRAFGVGSQWAVADIETVWEQYWEHLMTDLDGLKANGGQKRFTPESLRAFFTDTFIPTGPPSQHIRLLSRTVGADRIVDEILFSFCHSKEVPWLLPGVPPTNRDIQAVIVVVASFFADRIVHQSLYWDQADVLVQAGLLDPELVPRAKAAI